MHPKPHQWITFSLLWFICMLVYALNLWTPTRVALAPLEWPNFICAISGLLALISISYPYLYGLGGTTRLFLYQAGASVIFGITGWMVEDLLITFKDEVCFTWGHIPIALTGAIIYSAFAVPMHFIAKQSTKNRTISSSHDTTRPIDEVRL